MLQCGNVAVLQRGSVAVWQSGGPVGTPGPVFENVVNEVRLPPDALRHNLKELPLHLSQVASFCSSGHVGLQAFLERS